MATAGPPGAYFDSSVRPDTILKVRNLASDSRLSRIPSGYKPQNANAIEQFLKHFALAPFVKLRSER